jgi:hypothetical protein
LNGKKLYNSIGKFKSKLALKDKEPELESMVGVKEVRGNQVEMNMKGET